MFSFLLKFYLIPTPFKVLTLWFGVLGFSALRQFTNVPGTYFAKPNFFNTYFVKWSWAWTLVFLTPYAVLMAAIYSCDHWKRGIGAVLFRIGIATALWYFWTVIVFHWIENMTGVCFDSKQNPLFDVTDKISCVKLEGRHRWEGFDISGHAFLLTFVTLMISSELQVHRYWHHIPNQAARFLPIGSKSLLRLKARHKSTNNLAKWLFVFNCLVSLFWEFFLVCTCLYFHDFFSKAIGASLGILSWMLSYSELFPSRYLMVYPGHGPLKSFLLPNHHKEAEVNGVKAEKKNG